MIHSVRFQALAVILGVSSAACAHAVPPSGRAEHVQLVVTASEFKLVPNLPQIPAGRSVTLTFKNDGAIDHNVQIEGTTTRLAAGPRQTVNADVTLDTPGDYTFVCTIPGHQQAGMQTRVSVTPLDKAPASRQAQATEAVGQQASLPVIARLAQPAVAPPVGERGAARVHVDLETRQVTGMLADGIAYDFWTFNGSVPGPMVRVRQGDTVELTLKNAPTSAVTHSINIHAAHAPGGGSVDTQVAPGDDSTIRFQALNPGIYVYHCMTPPVDQHVTNGMYGLVVVEPPGGLPKVDREWYVMEGEFYVHSDAAVPGVRATDLAKLRDERPDYVVFNGSVGALSGEHALRAHVGEQIRIFFGMGGPNLDSSLHVVGGLFDRVYPEGASEFLTNVQTTLVPPGGATLVELTIPTPGHYMIEDHHISRLQKGAAAEIVVEGDQNLAVFEHVGRTGASAAEVH
jgi:nitrite reductase (NO-forming)